MRGAKFIELAAACVNGKLLSSLPLFFPSSLFFGCLFPPGALKGMHEAVWKMNRGPEH